MYLNDCKKNYTAVRRRLTICFCLLLLVFASGRFQPAAAHNSPINPGEWGNTIALTVLADNLYTVEKSGALYRTDLTTGKWIQLGKPEFARTAFLFSHGQNLFTIETDGNLYRVSPADGSWNRVGEPGAWRGTLALVVLDDHLYSIETSGVLYRTDLTSFRWTKLGKAEFGNTRLMFAHSPNLFTIEPDGNLYRVNPVDGSWSRIGSAGAWVNTIVGTTLNGKFYSVERDGALYETNLTLGGWKQIGKPEFRNSRFMFSSGASLYTIEGSGLYRINPSNGAWVEVGK